MILMSSWKEYRQFPARDSTKRAAVWEPQVCAIRGGTLQSILDDFACALTFISPNCACVQAVHWMRRLTTQRSTWSSSTRRKFPVRSPLTSTILSDSSQSHKQVMIQYQCPPVGPLDYAAEYFPKPDTDMNASLRRSMQRHFTPNTRLLVHTQLVEAGCRLHKM